MGTSSLGYKLTRVRVDQLPSVWNEMTINPEIGDVLHKGLSGHRIFRQVSIIIRLEQLLFICDLLQIV